MKIDCFTDTDFTNLNRVKTNIRDRRSVIYDAIGVYMVASVIETFEDEGRPEKWQPLASSTLKQKTGGMILHEFGALRGGIMSWVESNAVFIGPSGPSTVYSRIQQKGGQTGRDGATTIPARPFLVIQDEDAQYIRNLVRSEVFNG